VEVYLLSKTDAGLNAPKTTTLMDIHDDVLTSARKFLSRKYDFSTLAAVEDPHLFEETVHENYLSTLTKSRHSNNFTDEQKACVSRMCDTFSDIDLIEKSSSLEADDSLYRSFGMQTMCFQFKCIAKEFVPVIPQIVFPSACKKKQKPKTNLVYTK
jgi:hypothetical protein